MPSTLPLIGTRTTMMNRRRSLVALFWCVSGALFLWMPATGVGPSATADEKFASVYFPSKLAPNNFRVPEQFRDFERPLRASLENLSEAQLVEGVLAFGGPRFGLSTDQVNELLRSSKGVYSEMQKDAEFAKLESVIPYSLSNRKTRGHYFLSRCTGTSQRTILFLHGFGGNPLFNIWLLSRAFPDCDVIAPTSGIAWESGGLQYIAEVLASAKSRGVKVEKFELIVISQGGPTGFQYQLEHPDRVSNLVTLVSAPAADQVRVVRPGSRVCMINGSRDSRFPIAGVRSRIKPLSGRTNIDFEFHELNDDHFLMLTQPDKLFRIVRTRFGLPDRQAVR